MHFRLILLRANPDILVKDVVTLLKTMREAISYFPNIYHAYKELSFHELKAAIAKLTNEVVVVVGDRHEVG